MNRYAKDVLSLLVSAGAAAVFAQGPAAPVLPPLVRLNVVAVDNRGTPVTDLNADDFKVADQGKTPKRVLFRRPGDAKLIKASGGETVNRTDAAPPHTAIVLFDFLNESQANRLEAARKLAKSLPEVAGADTVFFYILTLDGKLYPVEPLVDDKGVPVTGDKAWVKDAEARIDKAVKSFGKARPAGLLQEDIVKKTYVALETLSNQLAAIPGRRDIIWITDSVPSVTDPRVTCSGDWVECALYVPHLVVTLEKNSTAVNTLSYGSGLGAMVTQAMEDLGGLTGGRPYFAEDLQTVVEHVRSDAKSSYTIAYDPGAENWDSKFHKIRLSCERKGVKLAGRNRYYALPETAQVAAIEQSALSGELKLQSDAPGIGLRAKATPVAGNPNMVHLQLRIEPSDLLTLEQGDHVDGQVSVVFGHYGSNGLLGMPGPATFNLRLSRPQYEAALKDGLAFDQDHAVEPAAKKIRFAIFDRGSRNLGSVTIPIPGR